VFTGTGLLFGILVIGFCLSFEICYLEFPLTQLLCEWIQKNLLFIQYPKTSPAAAGHHWLFCTQMSLQKFDTNFKILADEDI
jgi:hypothetical protein